MFAHDSAIKATGFRKLNEGDEVEFDRESSKNMEPGKNMESGRNGRGPQPANIVVTRAAPEADRGSGRW